MNENTRIKAEESWRGGATEEKEKDTQNQNK